MEDPPTRFVGSRMCLIYIHDRFASYWVNCVRSGVFSGSKLVLAPQTVDFDRLENGGSVDFSYGCLARLPHIVFVVKADPRIPLSSHSSLLTVGVMPRSPALIQVVYGSRGLGQRPRSAKASCYYRRQPLEQKIVPIGVVPSHQFNLYDQWSSSDKPGSKKCAYKIVTYIPS